MDYKFSVIIPLYNVDAYLTETVNSLLAQSIGFEDNIQLILVNDGSTDGTEKICLSFRDAYPDNITYVYQDNAGVSAARNTGIPYIRGKYTNFMDADDIWDEDAFKIVWDKFEDLPEEITVAACRMKLFEGKSGYPALDYKFKEGDIICDILEKPTYGQYFVNSVFCRSDAIEAPAFDTRLSYGEDAKFINRLILKAGKYALLKSAVYNLRKRSAGSSLTQGKLAKPTAYLDTATYYYKYMADLSVEMYGRIIPYVQYVLINAIKHRVTSAIPETIPADISGPYISMLNSLIARLDDDVICSAPQLLAETKFYLFRNKYGREGLKKLITVKNGIVSVNGHRAGRLFRKDCLTIDSVKKSLFKTVITGTVRCPDIAGSVSVRALSGSLVYEASLSPEPSQSRLSYTNETISSIYDFKLKIPAFKCRDPEKLKWVITADGNEITAAPVL